MNTETCRIFRLPRWNKASASESSRTAPAETAPGSLTLKRRGSLWFGALLMVLLMGGVAAPLLASETPKGLSSPDWSAIRAEYERHRHAAVPEPGGFKARNAAQQWMIHFDARGFTVKPDNAPWTWGLELERYGFAGSERRVRSGGPAAEKNHVRYERGGFQEWFINDGRGLEQGFILDERPHGQGLLRLDLAVRGGLKPQVTKDAVSFIDATGVGVLRYGGLKAWDATGKVLATRFEPAGAMVRLTVDERSARYPIMVDPIAQQAYLKASNTGAFDNFGYPVAVSGDSVVVVAPGEDSNATGVNGNQADNSAESSGAAYVFTRSGGVWSQQAYLKASNTEAGDYFGISVAVSGDTVVVGAFAEASNATGIDGNQANNSATTSGAAYVFTRSGGVWSQQAYLKASNTGAFDNFGFSVAVSGDTVVVGAFAEASNATGVNGNQGDNSAEFSGAAYVFTRSGGVWSQQTYLKASNTEANDWFGRSVAVFGDTVVVGAPLEDSNATGVNGNQANNSATTSGATYLFTRSGGVWSQQAYLKASNTGAGDQFGVSVAVSGDTVVVGAPLEDSNATGVNGNQANNSVSASGAAYVYTISTDTTPPIITPNVSGTQGANGWYISNVTVSWTVDDSESAVTSTGCDPSTVNTDTSGVTFTCSATSAGGTNSQSVTINRDAAIPGGFCANPDGLWHASDVSIACTASDGTSGLANTADASFNLTTSVAIGAETASASTNSRSIADRAGNTATAGPVGGNKIDKKAPSIAINTPASTSYLLNQAVTASYSCSDGGSGVASCAGLAANGAKIETASAGAKTFLVNTADNVGNRGSATVSYGVNYDFSGYLSPVYNPPTVNLGKAGKTYPVKWQLRDAKGNYISALSAVVSVTYQSTSCPANPGVPLASTTTGSTGLRYDKSSNQYVYNWGAPAVAGCYTLTLILDSGQTFPAYFKLSN